MRAWISLTPKSIAVGISVLLLTACGFKLRGIAEIPAWLNQVAIVMENASRNLEPLLQDQLTAYHVSVSPTKTQAHYWLVIEKDNFQKQITNISASTTPRQYLLLYSVQFSLLKNNGVALLQSNTVSVTRQFTLNNDRILGSDYEEMTFKQEMERDAASLIISRISAAKQPLIEKPHAKPVNSHLDKNQTAPGPRPKPTHAIEQDKVFDAH